MFDCADELFHVDVARHGALVAHVTVKQDWMAAYHVAVLRHMLQPLANVVVQQCFNRCCRLR